MARGEIIAVVDDDDSVRESLPDLLVSFGFQALPFSSAEAFLKSEAFADADCLILDVAMPGMSGPELQQELQRQERDIPVIFITARSEDQVWTALLSSGAAACLVKPFSAQAILDAINVALKQQ